MALVTSLEHLPKDRQSVHAPTTCTYTVVTDGSGHRFLQLDTYGSEERQIRGKISQSIQFDETAARQLRDLISATFPNL